ncbi:MAG: KpsF/GutQ family sugar-phosphate isomerase [Planctomycetota bacterium]|nr:KpsF/GutQ family sugar-phosphate isomerase [Planctomycetaceae bacterium]MDQ3330959.1 KpsF/GutQ family sugar-phosphate isomerase [Planctomycetota bacterium]
MSTAEALVPLTPLEQLRQAKEVLRAEAEAVASLADRLDGAFCDAADLLDDAGGVVVTGMGKAGLIGQKIAATLASLGVRARTLHPAEAVHGDLGALHPGDAVLALSHSGETEELVRLLPILKRMSLPVVAITASGSSSLGRAADVTLTLGRIAEVGPFGLAPTTSTTMMLALGDALAVTLAKRRSFTPQQFAVYHPAGNLGRKLALVGEIMRTGHELRVASEDRTIREIFATLARPGRRTGAVILTDVNGHLSGLFTDSDLARLLERRHEGQLDRSIGEVMTKNPITASPEMTLGDVVELLSRRKLSELPVIDADRRPVGLVDITDVLALLPEEAGDRSQESEERK